MVKTDNNKNKLITNDPYLNGYSDNDQNSKNEYNSDQPFSPEDLSQNKSIFTDWENEPTINLLKEDLEYARDDNRNQTNNVKGWLDIRNATNAESGLRFKKGNRSGVQPKLVRKHNEWRYPALSEPFLNSDRVFDVEPRTAEDGPAARQNQILLNWQFDTKLNKVDFIDRYVRTVVDEGTCVFRVGWSRKTVKMEVEKPTYDYYPITDPQQMVLLQQLIQMYKNTDPQYERLDDSIKAAVEYSIENNNPVYAVQSGTETVKEDVIIENKPTVKIVKIANFFIDPACEGIWEDAKFKIMTYESTRSDLKKRRIFKNLDKVNWSGNAIKSKTGDLDYESTSPQIDNRTTSDKQKVLVYEYWGEYDIHKTGEMVPIVVTFIGDTIIQMAENPFPDKKAPFVIVPYMPILESSFGEADASLLQDNQRIVGAVTRGMIDLLGKSANAQTGYPKNFLDPVNRSRFTKGEDFEYNQNSHPTAAIQQMKYPEIPNSALTVIQMNEAEAEGLSGVKSFTSGVSGDSFGKVARGISSATDAAGQREMSIIRRLGEGLKLLGAKIVAMNVIFLEDREVIRITNENFVEIKREDLEGNFDLKVDISSQATDEAKSQDLGFMLQTTGPDMEPGLRSLILAEIADLKRMPELAERIRNYKPEPDPLQQQLQQMELKKLETDIALNEARTAEALARADHTAQDTLLEGDGTKHNRTIEAQGAQARGNRDLEVTKGLLAGNVPSGNIEAAVGFNEIIKETNEKPINKPVGSDALLPINNTLPVLNDPTQPVAFPQ